MKRHRRLLVTALVLLPSFPAAAQPKARVFRVVGLSNSTAESTAAYVRALNEAFRELGYAAGTNLAVEHVLSEGRPERLPALAAEIVRRKPDVIIAASNAETAALKAATATIPIIIALGAGPVESGLVESLARPGGNITGTSTGASSEIVAKWLELLRDVKPELKRVGVLWDPGVPGFQRFVITLEEASRKLGMTLRWYPVKHRDELDAVLTKLSGEKLEALCVIANALTFALHQRIVAFVTEQRLPAISYMSEFVAAGFLMSYGADLLQLYKRSALYADRIFKGARPSELPIEQPTRYETVVNLKTAKALGLTIPRSLLLRADKVIE